MCKFWHGKAFAPLADHWRDSRFRNNGAALLVWGLLFLLIGCRNPAPPGRARNVVLISIDTCRADRLSCYGYGKETTPNIDRLAESACLFEFALSPVPITLPSHCSMLTGLLPPSHGVRDNTNYRLPDNLETVATVLKREGYKTAAFVGSVVMDAKFGLDRGFDGYNDSRFFLAGKQDYSTFFLERNAEEVTSEACAWVQTIGESKRFFVFLHLFDPHGLYHPPEPYASLYADEPYTGEIAYTDSALATVFRTLKDKGLWDDTLIVLTSDHGESLGEHEETTHSFFLYQSTLSVPLIVRAPGIHVERRVPVQVSLIDILPTVLSYLEVRVPGGVQGVNLLPLMTNEQSVETSAERILYSETLTPTKYGCAPLFCALDGRWKYIHSPKPECYDLKADPRELNNCISKSPKGIARLRERLGQMLQEHRRAAHGSSHYQPTEEDLRKLESLGYVVSKRVREATESFDTRRDAKDFIGLHEKLLECRILVGEERFDEVETVCRKILVETGPIADVFRLLGRISFREKNFSEAIRYYLDYVKTVEAESASESVEGGYERLHEEQSLAAVHNNLGLAYSSLDNVAEAVRHYSLACEFEPDNSKIRNNLVSVLSGQKALSEAFQHYVQAVKADPTSFGAGFDFCEAVLARIDQSPDELAKVEALFNRASGADDSILAIVFEYLGGGFLSTRAFELSQRCFLESLKHAPERENARLGLAEVLREVGKPSEAIQEYRKVLGSNPKCLEALCKLAWVFATCSDSSLRNGAEAIKMAEAAAAMTGRANWTVLDVLGASYAEAGRYQEAAETAEEAMKFAEMQEDHSLLRAVRHRLQLYMLKKPFREPPKGQDLKTREISNN